ncbi:MAG: hypothetical protein KA152_13470 [Verrucomicrobiales bacterium]|nr:hypothetical protein [Verrucomicrobiales bacterium]
MPHRLLLLLVPLLTVSCQIKPYAPPPQRALVESVEVAVRIFEGRPEAEAVVKGRLSSSAAQLIDARQSREDGILYLEVLEQTPRGASLLTNLAESPPFMTRIPIEILGLDPGPCRLNANGIEIDFEIPTLKASLVSAEIGPTVPESRIKLIDEFIPIEEVSPAPPTAGITSGRPQ